MTVYCKNCWQSDYHRCEKDKQRVQTPYSLETKINYQDCRELNKDNNCPYHDKIGWFEGFLAAISAPGP